MHWKYLAYHLPSPSSLLKKEWMHLFFVKIYSIVIIIIAIICFGVDSIVQRNVRKRQLGTLCQHFYIVIYSVRV